MIRPLKSFSVSLLSSLLFYSCHLNPGIKKAEFYEFGDEGMKPDLEYVFYPFENTTDSTNFISLSMVLRYSDLCELSQLPLDVEYASLKSDSIKNLKINLPLFDSKGNELGKGNFGLYETSVNLLKSEVDKEGFFISVSTPETRTQGIISLGIVCD